MMMSNDTTPREQDSHFQEDGTPSSSKRRKLAASAHTNRGQYVAQACENCRRRKGTADSEIGVDSV